MYVKKFSLDLDSLDTKLFFFLEDSDLLRMDVEDFSYLLGKVTPFIQRRDTKLRRAIKCKNAAVTNATVTCYR